ncbi:MAG: addiction module protein [Desulfomonile tiedjei]|nr:addiction module protein [Desulfomonile tiedjei]
MTQSEIAGEIKQLTVAERLLLVQEIWDSIVADQESLPVTEAQKKELDKRLESYLAAPQEGSSWEEVKQRVMGDK